MIKLQNIKDNARSRRAAKRQEKQQAWKCENPMGRQHKVEAQRISLVKRAGYSPAPLKFLARNAFGAARDYKMQIVRASYLYQYEFNRKPLDEGAMCLPQVAMFAAGHRKPTETITAR